VRSRRNVVVDAEDRVFCRLVAVGVRARACHVRRGTRTIIIVCTLATLLKHVFISSVPYKHTRDNTPIIYYNIYIVRPICCLYNSGFLRCFFLRDWRPIIFMNRPRRNDCRFGKPYTRRMSFFRFITKSHVKKNTHVCIYIFDLFKSLRNYKTRTRC